jgi:hypothetical protein
MSRTLRYYCATSAAKVAQRAGSEGGRRYIVETGPVKILICMCT